MRAQPRMRDDVFFVRKGGKVPDEPAASIEAWLYKRGGSHGGKANWKQR